jgi:hypothetical protein
MSNVIGASERKKRWHHRSIKITERQGDMSDSKFGQ